MNQLVDRVREAARDEGFVMCGVTPAVDSAGFSNLVRWIEAGYAGGMSYLENRLDAYQHPRGVLDSVRTIIVLAYPYANAPPSADPQPLADSQPLRGTIARYAWSGDDYHDVVHPKLKRLCKILRGWPGELAEPDLHDPPAARGIVDTAPLMEREVAQLAGLGWRGKNTLLLNRQLGSYFFLACLLTNLDLPVDAEHNTAHCGTCTACLDACPTSAFPQPGVLNASRCISYLTIEHDGPIDRELREPMGNWLFGCDVCQEVCPWNRKPSRVGSTGDSTLQDATNATSQTAARSLESLELTTLFSLSDEQFRAQFRKTPLWRTRRRGILRNAAIVLGNQGRQGAVDALTIGLNDAEPVVRGASAWALGKIAGQQAIQRLRERQATEPADEVRDEIDAALVQ